MDSQNPPPISGNPKFWWQMIYIWLPVAAVILLAASTAVQSADIGTVTIAYEREVLDLDTGSVGELSPEKLIESGDIRVAYNASRSTKSVLVAEGTGREIAVVEGLSFDGVTEETITDVVFSGVPVDVPFSSDVTVLVRTDLGVVFKLGNATETAVSVTFNYAALGVEAGS